MSYYICPIIVVKSYYIFHTLDLITIMGQRTILLTIKWISNESLDGLVLTYNFDYI